MSRLHKPEFKAKVTLAAIKGELSMAEMVKMFDVQAPQITKCKKQLLASAGDAFDKRDKIAEDHETTTLDLRAKVVELTMEIGVRDSRCNIAESSYNINDSNLNIDMEIYGSAHY